jgi:coronin-1B/1C/6
LQAPGEKYVPKVVKVVRSSKFRHIAGKGTKMDDCFTNLKVNTAANNSVIRANRTFFCVPWQGSGGLVAVIPLKKTGRTSDKIPFIETGSACLDFDFNPFDDHLLATTTESAYVQLWKIPVGGLTGVMKDPSLVLKGNFDEHSFSYL